MERSGMMAGFRATRAIRDSRPRSPATGSRTNLVFPAGSANFASAACGAPRKLDRPRDYCRRLARAKPRGLMLVLADMRSIAASGILFFGRARVVLTVSAVCGRRNEARALRRRLRIAAAEWSGCKAGESVIVRGRNRADTWQRKCRLGEAGLLSFPDEERSDEGGSATCLLCLTPRLKSSANLNGWNARKTFDNL